MTKYHVCCGLVGIYAGILKPNGVEWKNKSDVTNEVLCASAQYLMFGSKEFRFQYENKWYVMRVEEVEEE